MQQFLSATVTSAQWYEQKHVEGEIAPSLLYFWSSDKVDSYLVLLGVKSA